MSSPGTAPGSLKRVQRFWLVLIVALVLGFGSFGWLNYERDAPRLLALLSACAMLLAVTSYVVSRRWRLAGAQPDKAPAGETKSLMSGTLQQLDVCAQEPVCRRLQELQSEIFELRAKSLLLQVQAHHDGLTGLANRALLADRFHFAAERSKRSGLSFALLMVDLNDFKTINDNYGHAAGDAVLVTIAKRLAGAVRASDTVARLGGDEFVLIIESFKDPKELAQVGQKLIDTLSVAITLDNAAVVTVGASVGLALYPDHGTDINDLLGVADHAMYECKSVGQLSLH